MISRLSRHGILNAALLCALAAVPMWSAPGQGAGKKGNAGKTRFPWDARPTLEQIYEGYRPAFSRDKLEGDPAKFSRQDRFMSVADVRMDAQVQPILTRANELATEGEHRRATEHYRDILERFPDELVQIAEEGVFVPASLYAQRRILAYPQNELTYYRLLYDPAARDIYERARRRYSIFDYKDLAKFHLATSYGDKALYALANDALDKANYDEARRYYERIVTYHGLTDESIAEEKLDRDQIWVRLAICYRHLGREPEYKAAVAKIKSNREGTVANLLKQLSRRQYDEFAVRQREGRRSARYDALDDRSLAEPLPYAFSDVRGEWETTLAGRHRGDEPDVLPWATETDLIYKDKNVLYSRSLLTGEPNWAFGPGGSSFDWDRYIHRGGDGRIWYQYYPNQSILVHEGVAFAHMFVYGPSLAAVDQYTGRMLWAKGPMAARDDEEWLDRYQSGPAAGRGMVIAPVVHDDIRGRSHISSSADLAAFETRTGALLWRTTLARIAPLKITQSRYPRKIRILSTTPLVHDGVVYHVTNAGVVAALDAVTGDVRWITRYPQNRGVLDNLSDPGLVWRNDPPLIRDRFLYVTPVDSGFLLCLDKDTGRIEWTATRNRDSSWPAGRQAKGFGQVWRMAGFTPEGDLCLSGSDLVFLNARTGQLAHRLSVGGGWVNTHPVRGGNIPERSGEPPKGLEPGVTGEGDDFWWPLGHIHTMPTIATDGKIAFGMQFWFGNPGPKQAPFVSEYVYDLKERGIVGQRRWYDPVSFVETFGYASPLTVVKRPVNEEPERFDPAMRMSVVRWGVPFEISVSNRRIVARYDAKKMGAALAKGRDMNTLFGRAELARKARDVRGAIALYEQCKPLLPAEEEDVRRNINLRLYPLYTETARWGHQASDWKGLEEACRNMGATATNPTQEIRALMAYGELHERRGAWLRAAQALQNASRHYWREPLRVSNLETRDRGQVRKRAESALETLVGETPPPYREQVKRLAEMERRALDDYFLSVANVDADLVVETRWAMANRLRGLLARAPGEFRGAYERAADEDLKRHEAPEASERLLWCWPETATSRARLKELEKRARGLAGVERQAMLWRLGDLAQVAGLGAVADADQGLRPTPPAAGMSLGAGLREVEEENEDPDTVRLALAQEGETEATAHLLFTGGRRRQAYGNRFTVKCRDMRTNRKLWETGDILLHGRTMGEEGFETGFDRVLVWRHLAIVHGRFDALAVEWADGKGMDERGRKTPAWRFRVPLGFEIERAGLCGDVLILCGPGSTLALAAETGEIVWEEPEAGSFYAGPFFEGGQMLTVRNSPSEVSFRHLGSGRLLARVRLPGLTTNRSHPVYALDDSGQNPAAAEAAEAYPVAFGSGALAVTDGTTYHVVDLAERRVRWSARATNLDLSRDPSYRLWIDGGRLFVLKPYYAVLENVVFDLASGDRLWRRREGGKKMDAKLKDYAAQEGEEGKAATGLVLSSMVFVDGRAYGIRYEMGTTSVTLVGMDPATGNETMRVEETGYQAPEAYAERSWSHGAVAVRLQDENRFEVWQVDAKEGKLARKTQMEGYGRLGEYGDVSAVWQGPYQALWAFAKRKVTVGKP